MSCVSATRATRNEKILPMAHADVTNEGALPCGVYGAVTRGLQVAGPGTRVA